MMCDHCNLMSCSTLSTQVAHVMLGKMAVTVESTELSCKYNNMQHNHEVIL